MVGALGSALNHIYQVGSEFDACFDAFILCKLCLFAVGLGNSARVLMATFYALTVFIVVRWWNIPVLASRNTKYFISGAVFVWLLVIPLVVPPLVTGVSAFCSRPTNEMKNNSEIYAVPLYFLLSIFPILLTLLFLVTPVCLIKRRTITENRVTRKALLKFGLSCNWPRNECLCSDHLFSSIVGTVISQGQISGCQDTHCNC